ncbi:hypothetical protein K466DRAFT_64595 [Polyporus arcularius HHB13444]|uniref:Uncharacterized protein n=1 Tax=Polyporus arcularius HHB13444 TaxID=1314778 RepID=A0A5C3PR78_9APHY|nr:hypothetical protein K466DRAFT_64595 [Polyporus arcularius HHB13444]
MPRARAMDPQTSDRTSLTTCLLRWRAAVRPLIRPYMERELDAAEVPACICITTTRLGDPQRRFRTPPWFPPVKRLLENVSDSRRRRSPKLRLSRFEIVGVGVLSKHVCESSDALLSKAFDRFGHVHDRPGRCHAIMTVQEQTMRYVCNEHAPVELERQCGMSPSSMAWLRPSRLLLCHHRRRNADRQVDSPRACPPLARLASHRYQGCTSGNTTCIVDISITICAFPSASRLPFVASRSLARLRYPGAPFTALDSLGLVGTRKAESGLLGCCLTAITRLLSTVSVYIANRRRAARTSICAHDMLGSSVPPVQTRFDPYSRRSSSAAL